MRYDEFHALHQTKHSRLSWHSIELSECKIVLKVQELLNHEQVRVLERINIFVLHHNIRVKLS